MSDTKGEQIRSGDIHPRELIKSADFIIGLEIILLQVKTFHKDAILALFNTIQNNEALDESGKAELLQFVTHDKVAKKGEELLSKLKDESTNPDLKDSLSQVTSFSELLNSIFLADGNTPVTKQIGEVADTTQAILDAYEGFKKLQIKVHGETREIYLENENFMVKSSHWKKKTIGGVRVKINPEGDIIEFLEGEGAGQQLFTQASAQREAQKLGKRLPFAHDKNKEFQAIIEKVGVEEFKKTFAGYRDSDGKDFGSRGYNAYFWSASENGDAMEFHKGDSKADHYWHSKSYGFSVRCVKD